MNCIHTTVLSEGQKKEITGLATACALAEPISLSAPLEDGLSYFLGYEGKELVSMVFLFFPEETVCECGAYTLPESRQKGYFSRLLDEALAFVEEYEKSRNPDVDFCFLTDGKSPDAAAALKALGAEYWYSEYSMSLDLPASGPVSKERPSLHTQTWKGADETCPPLRITEAEQHLYTAALDDTAVGVCLILPNGNSVYFYGFEIKESFRRRGYGQHFLTAMIELLSKDYRRITLQVSSQNTPAVNLYKKTGFHITETLSYYLY